jgi:hypothetical protein
MSRYWGVKYDAFGCYGNNNHNHVDDGCLFYFYAKLDTHFRFEVFIDESYRRVRLAGPLRRCCQVDPDAER